MSRIIHLASRAVMVLLLLASTPALAWEHHHGWSHGHWYGPRVVIGVGPLWGPYYAPWGYYPPPYVAAYPPPVVVQPPPEPPVYTERQDAPPAEEEQAAPAPQQEGAYWYYCPGAHEYYPKVGTCSEQWVKVPATPQ